jgi:hypothetical protein
MAAVLGQAPIGPATGTPYRGASATSDAVQTPAANSNPIFVGPRSGVQQSPLPQPQINPVRRVSAAEPQSAVTPLGTYSPPGANAGRPQGRVATASGQMGRQPAAADADPLARIREEAYRSEVARRQAERAQLQGLSSIPNPLMQRRPTVAPPQIMQAANTVPTDPHQARIRELQQRIEQQRQHLRALEEALQQEVAGAR